jgi:hypothetical protein
MALEIKSNDTLVKLNIEKLGNKSLDVENDRNYWLIIDISVKNKWFNYYDNGETLEFSDIVRLSEDFKEMLDGKITEDQYIFFTEPDFEFVFHPPVNIGSNRIEPTIDFIINLTDNSKAYTGEQYILPLDTDNSLKLIDCFNEAIERLTPKNYT